MNASQNHPVALPSPFPPSQSGGLDRALRFVRGMGVQAVVLTAIVGGLELAVPHPFKPSDILGGLAGSIESAETNAKREAQVELQRRQTQEVSREQFKVQAEAEILRQQMQTLSETMAGQTQIAIGADWLCTLGRAVPVVTDNPDYRGYGKVMEGACGQADRIREQQQAKYVELSRRYAALVARDDELHRQLIELRRPVK